MVIRAVKAIIGIMFMAFTLVATRFITRYDEYTNPGNIFYLFYIV
jgi:hypothetical protein